MIGLLDLPAIALGTLDGWLAPLLPAALRILLWGCIAGVIGMALYARFSPQSRLEALKQELSAAQRALAGYDGPLSGLWPLMRRQFGLALTQLRLVLWPSLLAGLPVILLWTGLSLRFDAEIPAPGTPVRVELLPATALAAAPRWEPGGLVPDADGAVLLPWPAPGAPARLVQDGREWLQIEAGTRRYSVQPSAWDWLSASYTTLRSDQPVQTVHADLPPRRFLPAVPNWLAGWEALFITATLLASLFCKWRWRIR